ncbi:A disintegrin and metalloproteinase with thrombospondin motifs 10 [Chelonia mydas]|uniref:A disintegrin and metalloproteinase with thrombospondin motifs 10 n=1 Tax=Chelonia mydas TaxID=8469 RepID=M7BD73_CHEMY|nr:A disintegrin and metalloproteinase with thrombospondin motifs 10 [Chelonia mydas]
MLGQSPLGWYNAPCAETSIANHGNSLEASDMDSHLHHSGVRLSRLQIPVTRFCSKAPWLCEALEIQRIWSEFDVSVNSQSVQQPQEEFLSSLDHYEIAFPIQVDQNGDFLTFDMRSQLKRRSRRSLGSLSYEAAERRVFYKVSAHRTQFLLNLTLHSNLLSEHFTVEYWKRDGVDWQHDFHEDCHYAGHLQDRYLNSKVAISNCNGLHGVIVADEEEYFIEPLSLGANVSTESEGEGSPHVVYKRSSLQHSHMDAACGVLDEKPWKGRPWWLRTLKPPPLKPSSNNSQRGQLPLKRSVSTERYVETLVVADKMMVGYHGRRDIEQYILAIMNIVSVTPTSRPPGVLVAPQDGSHGDSHVPTLLVNRDRLPGSRWEVDCRVRHAEGPPISWRIIGSPGTGHN